MQAKQFYDKRILKNKHALEVGKEILTKITSKQWVNYIKLTDYVCIYGINSK